MSRLVKFVGTLVLALGVSTPAHAIVGGNDADPGEYPYVAHILIDKNFSCTGTLVTPRHVVTAAHCSTLVPAAWPTSHRQAGAADRVSIGSHGSVGKLTGYGSDGEHHVASAVHVNRGWAGLGSVGHDAMIIEFERPREAPVKVASAGRALPLVTGKWRRLPASA